SRPPINRAARTLVKETLPYPDRFRLAFQGGRVGRWLRGALPGELGAMLDMLPDALPSAEPLPEVYPAQGP
ncbi:MAG: 2-hydroxy-acid oxidase, partial [Caldilinea sp.]|nr:2-hydroxy-acid oxidase [Caldilinea sp.]